MQFYLGVDVNLHYKQVSWEMLNYCHSPATDWDSWKWKEDSGFLLSHLEKHKSPRFTASCTKVLFLLCSCAVICIVLFVKGPAFFLLKAILKFCTSCFQHLQGPMVRFWDPPGFCKSFPCFSFLLKGLNRGRGWIELFTSWYTALLRTALCYLYHRNVQELACILSAFCSWQFACECQQVFNSCCM